MSALQNQPVAAPAAPKALNTLVAVSTFVAGTLVAAIMLIILAVAMPLALLVTALAGKKPAAAARQGWTPVTACS